MYVFGGVEGGEGFTKVQRYAGVSIKCARITQFSKVPQTFPQPETCH